MAESAAEKPKPDLSQNKANVMLRKAAEGKYAIPGVCVVSLSRPSPGSNRTAYHRSPNAAAPTKHPLSSLNTPPPKIPSSSPPSPTTPHPSPPQLTNQPQYNLEGILATVRAATAKSSPAMILLFPWAQTYSSTLLAQAAATAARAAPVPITLHLDHAQSAAAVRTAAASGFYDSIMVDMSHYDRDENLARTRELVQFCHERGIVCEAEPGRIMGGEDGVADTVDLQAVMTSAEEARAFVDTGIDWLAPAFGNVHGSYGKRGIRLEFERLEEVREAVGGEVRLVLHGTDGFDRGVYERCVRGGISKVNINGVLNRRYLEVQREGWRGVSETMEEGTRVMQVAVEECMDMLGSTGKA